MPPQHRVSLPPQSPLLPMTIQCVRAGNLVYLAPRRLQRLLSCWHVVQGSILVEMKIKQNGADPRTCCARGRSREEFCNEEHSIFKVSERGPSNHMQSTTESLKSRHGSIAFWRPQTHQNLFQRQPLQCKAMERSWILLRAVSSLKLFTLIPEQDGLVRETETGVAKGCQIVYFLRPLVLYLSSLFLPPFPSVGFDSRLNSIKSFFFSMPRSHLLLFRLKVCSLKLGHGADL